MISKPAILLSLCCVMFLPVAAFADLAQPLSKEEAILRAEFIAIVKVSHVRPVRIKGTFFTYSQAASAVVERRIKGELPETITMFGGEDFPCAQVDFAPGRYLVFLRTENKLLRAAEWQTSIRPIERDVVEWYSDDGSYEMKAASLGFVLKEIGNTLGYSIEPKAEADKAQNTAQPEKRKLYLSLILIASSLVVFALAHLMFRGITLD